MNDFHGLLSTDYGFKPSGKSAPMAAPSKSTKTTPTSSSSSSSFLPDQDSLFRPIRNSDYPNSTNFDHVFPNSKSTTTTTNNNNHNFDSNFSSMPVFDKPVYDDDHHDHDHDVASSPVNQYSDIFASKKPGGAGTPTPTSNAGDAFHDLFGGLGKNKNDPLPAKSTSKGRDNGVSTFDDLLPGFGATSSINRSSSVATANSSSKLDNPFVVLESTSPQVSSSSGVFSDPLEEIGSLNNTGSKNLKNNSGRGVFDDIDPLGGFAQSVPPLSAGMNGREKDENPLQRGSKVSGRQTSAGAERGQKSSVTSPERGFDKKVPEEEFPKSSHNVFRMPSVSADSGRSVPNAPSPVYNNSSFGTSFSHGHESPPLEENLGSFDEVWLTVSEIPLFTQPTTAPPPSRPPPPRSVQFSSAESGAFSVSNAQSKVNEYSSFPSSNQYFQSPKSPPTGATSSYASPFDELGEFAAGRKQSNVDENSDLHSGDDFDSNSVAAASAAAMKEAMDRAEAKFRYARVVRERDTVKAARSRESLSVEKEVKGDNDAQDREFREGQERLMREREQTDKEEEERRRRGEEDRTRVEKEQEEKEREKRRVERERELARQAVERATREARERAAIEARMRAERAAVQKANSEARERAERAAVQRAQAEARERAAADAKERAEKAAAEAREKTRFEAREKEARERATAASTATQQNSEPDLDSIFGVGSRASSAPRPRATSSSKPAPEATRTSVNSASSMRKASSSTSIVNDLTSIFGGPSSFGDFPDVDGETEDRRRARLERHHRTQERAAKALAEKNARDLEAQREQAEKDRMSETLDVEIKRWAAGKEGNLRALLSTLQYVLWPECGWQPVSLTDLITGASVKKVYRKATLCIHPDKVQQKGANLQQKFVAEKVFDLLKEAWNKFNSEELF